MATKWSEIESKPEYQGASAEQKQAVADGFFNDVIKPNIPAGADANKIKTDFMSRAIPPKPSIGERISAGLSDLVTPRTVVNPNAQAKPSTFKHDTQAIDKLLPTVARDRVKDGQSRATGQLVQQGYEPREAAEVALDYDAGRLERLNNQATKPVDMSYAREMREKPKRSLANYFQDTAGSVVKIPGAMVRDVANIGNMLTGDSMPTDVAGTMQRGMDEFDRRYGSDARNFENQEFSRIANNPDQDFTSQVDYLLQNPTFLADQGITTVGSMFLPAGASAGALKVADKLFKGKVPDIVSRALRNTTIAGTVAMQNAAETFNDPDMHDVPLDVRYEAAGITALGTLLGNKIFGGGIEKAIADKFNKSGAAHGMALAAKEGGQEAFESLSQSGGKAYALPGEVSLNQAVGNALMEGTIGAVMGGGVAAVGMSGNENSQEAEPTVAPKTKGQTIIEYLKRQKGIPTDSPVSTQANQTQKPTATQAKPTEAINASDILEDDNVSVPTATNSTELAAGTVSNELDNSQAGIGDQLSNGAPDVNGTGLDSGASTTGLRPDASTGTGADTSLNNELDAKANEAATSTLNEREEPTEARKEAGNYKVGRIKVGGLNISVENPDQSKRKGVDRDGNAWESTMNGHYGYVRGDGVKARAPDKEHIDVNVKAGTAEDYAGDVFVINQNDPQTGKFDEPKVYIGYANENEAEGAYRSNYADDWKGFGDVVRMPMAKFKEMLGNEKAFLKPVKQSKAKPRQKAPKVHTLLTALDSLGGLDTKYKWDISGEQKFARGGYNKVFRNAATKTLEEHIQNGDLDDFLPHEMRSMVSDDPTAGRDYLADKIRNGERVLPYDVELEAKQSKYYENSDIQQDIDALVEDLDLDQINSLLNEAGYDERQSAAEATDYTGRASGDETQNTESRGATSGTVSSAGSQNTNASAQNADAGQNRSEPGQERPGVREIVTAIVRRRSAANQIGKSKDFDDYLAAAKSFMAGNDVKPARFKVAAATFKNDTPLSDAYLQLADLAKAPAKEARATTSSIIEQFSQRIDQATTADQLRDIVREIQQSDLTDTKAEELDAKAMDKLDSLEGDEPVKPATNTDLLGDDTAKQQAVADAERAKDTKRNAGTTETGDFVLTGSNRDVDEAAARGAQDLFSPAEPAKKLENATAPEHVSTEDDQGVTVDELRQIAKAWRSEIDAGRDAEITHIFDSPAKGEIVRLNDKVKVYTEANGWMTPAEAKKKISEWKQHVKDQANNQDARRLNSDKVVLSFFDLSGEWSKPWEEAGYQVYRFDIQDDPDMGDVNNFSTEFFQDWFGDFEGQDIHAILAACPCTDFAVSGARHFAAKDADGRTVSSVRLVKKTLAAIEYFKPSVWALENPVGRIEDLTGLPPWRLSFDPNHLGDPYTKKTLIWGRFNGDLPIAPVEPTEGSKMHKLYGGKSQATKNARSVTPEGFSYGFFMANNAYDNLAMTIANKYDRLDASLISRAIEAGITQEQISDAVDDFYYMDLNDTAANDAIKQLIEDSDQSPDATKMVDSQSEEPHIAKESDLDATRIDNGYKHRVLSSTSGIIKIERQDYVNAVSSLYNDLLPIAKNDAQKEALKQLTADFKQEYIKRRHRVMDIGSTVVSSAVAGRSKFNSRQSASRGNALDRAESDFSQWLKSQPAIAKNKINNLKTEAERAEEKVKADEKAAKNKSSIMKIMRSIDQFKSGDTVKFGSYNIARVSFDRDGYPSSVTVDATDLTDNKFDLAKTLFSGSKQNLRALVDEMRADNKVEPAAEEVAQTETTPLSQYESVIAAFQNGTAKVEDYKAAFDYVVNNEQAITDYLNDNFTKPQLLDRFNVERYKAEPKARMVSAAYGDIVRDFLLPDEKGMITSSYSFGGGDKYADIKRQVGEITQESLDAAMQRRIERVKQNEAQRSERLKGMDDPKTLDDFTNYMRAKTAEGMTFQQARMTLTPQQRVAYDELVASYNRDARKDRVNTQKTQVQATASTTSGEIVETKHTKTGEPLFVVKAADRVDREVYNQWNTTAKRMGGYYSSFRGAGAVPGFQFKSIENAQAFLQYLGGDTEQAKEAIQAKRDAYADDRSQTAVERLTEMAERLEQSANEQLGRERKVNTARRAGMAARAEAAAEADKAMALTMRNIATAIQSGNAKYIDQVRQKTQVELLQRMVNDAHYKQGIEKYKSYAEYEKHRYDPANIETADYAEFPSYTLFRSDWARLGRAMVETDGLKQLGAKILSTADDVTDAYIKFAKENIAKVGTYMNSNGLPAMFSSKGLAEEAIARSGYNGKAIPLQIKRGQYQIVESPGAAMEKGTWKGDSDARITLGADFVNEVVEKIGKANRRANKVEMPWQLESIYDRRMKLKRMNIETPAEMRAALREFIDLQQIAKAPDKVKELERSMIGRRADGLDFFPTPADTADTMIDVAEIKEGMTILEPSAGMAHIADRIRAAGFEPDVAELSADRRELLEAKGYNIAGTDFLAMTGSYDRIIMNPPFSDRRDMEHVQHAYNMLNPGGRMVAIVGEGVFFGSDKKATGFREWLDSVGGTSEKLEEGTFNDPNLPVNTSANARMVVIDKDAGDSASFSRNNTAPIFYSQLSKTINESKQDVWPAKQWKLWLLGNAGKLGIKKDEIQWTGITDWLDLQTGKISKADIQDYLDGNGVQVTETLLGDGGMPALPEGWEVERQPNGEYFLLDSDGEVVSEGQTEREAIENGIDADELADNPDGAGETKYRKYVVPGGEGYKELLLTLPYKSNAPTYEQWKDNQLFLDENNDVSIEKYNDEVGFYDKRGTYSKATLYKSSHWSEPNILAHIRFDERTDADGKRVLFVQEIQSDWGQDGKKKGFKPDQELYDKEIFEYKVLKGKALRNQITDQERARYNQLGSRFGTVPNAPFVTDTKSWVALALKRMLRYAADNGFEKIAFINGQQAADLYDLSKQVDSIQWETRSLIVNDGIATKRVTIEGANGDGGYIFKVNSENGEVYANISRSEQFVGKSLEDIVGKPVAEKILADSAGSLSGEGLSIGGEGMRTFYDKIVPQVANDVLKKVGGGRVESTTFFAPIELRDEDFDSKAIAITPAMADQISGGLPLFKREQSHAASGLSIEAANRIAAELLAKYPNLPTVNVVASRNDIPLPKSVADEINAALSRKSSLLNKAAAEEEPSKKLQFLMKSLSVNVSDVEGMYKDGQVWINAGAIRDEQRFREVFAHETIGHLSIETMLNEVDKGLLPKLLKNVQNLNKMGNKYIREVWNDVAVKQPGLGANAHAKEVLAFIVERGDQNKDFTPMVRTLWQRIIDGIKAFAKLVFNVDLNDGDVRDIMSMAERYAKGNVKKSDLVSVMANGNAYFSFGGGVQEIPDTIKVNGIDRATRNSKGDLIYPTEDGIRNFWGWFDDVGAGKTGDGAVAQDVRSSEVSGRVGRTDNSTWPGKGVLDREGRPAVLYHGTSDSFDTFELGHKNQKDLGWLGNGIYLTNDPQLARFYAEQKKGEASPNIMPLYAAIKNPYIATIADKSKLKNASKAEIKAFTDGLKAKGHDGVLLEYNDEESELVAFNSNQLKSAAGNNGGFDGGNSNILFSRQMPLDPDWKSLEESGRLKDVQYQLQDKHTDMKDVIKAIKAAGRIVTDRFNPYLQEELYHGRVAKRIQDFAKTELEPLLKAMNDSGVTMADFEHYLWARHAEERNAQIAKINPDMPDGGSGLTDKEARDYLAQIPAKDKAVYEKLAERVDSINSTSRNLLVEYGIEDMDTAAKMEEAYKHYVPLMRDEMEKGYGSGTGQGFSIKGNSTKRAMGSNKAVVDIIANIAAQREKFIVRGEKNRVATALVGLAKLNPNDDFWKVDKPPVLRYISQATGLVEEMTDPNYKNRDNVVVARILDRNGRVQERAVVFNEYDKRAQRMAESFKNLDVDGMEEWMSSIAKVTRYFASVNTQYNPIFGMVNILRDTQAGALNLESTKLAGMQKDVIGQAGSAWWGIYKDLRSDRKGEKATGHWSELWEQYQNDGGQTGYRELFRSAKDRTEELNKIVDPDWWKSKGWGKIVSLNNDMIANAEALAADKVGKPIFQWLDDYNASLENSVRLSAYKVALDKGLSRQEAASIAKNLTVNFNRKGASGARMGALYAFFNASVQGTARLSETMLKDGKVSLVGKRILTGGILLGVLQALALAGFDDEEPPQFERDRNLIIPIGGNKYIKIPMPLGFHVIPATARVLTEYALRGADNTPEMMVHIAELFADAFNPVGGSSTLAQILSPTATDPIIDLTINKDFAGRSIAQQDFNSLDPTPGFTRARDTASRVSTVLSELLNKVTGGTDYQPGIFSPTPDQIDYLVGQMFGGVGREILKIDSTARSIADGTDLPAYKIPVAGKFYGDASSQSSEGRKFYSNIEKMNGHENEIKGRMKDGKEIQSYIDKNPDAKLWRQARFSFKTIKKLRDRRDNLLQSGAPQSEVKAVDEIITNRMHSFNELVESAKK